MKKTIKECVAALTLEEKISLTSGANSWETAAVPRLGIPALVHADGPYGIRREEKSADGEYKLNQNHVSVCYPASVAAASSFDADLIRQEGEILGEQCRAEKVNILLGPGNNIKRTPLCGRNFEYYSEDPYLSSRLAAAYICGVQKKGVGTSLKHYFANNQETGRMSVSAQIDERTEREIYLAAFEYAVAEGKPWSVMASYNKIGGVYSTENEKYLAMLRKEWGFDGYVVSDWGATHDRVKAVAAGTDLSMPSDKENDKKLVQAVKEGVLSEDALNVACEHILSVVSRAVYGTNEFDYEKGHAFARKMEEECAVLLKNDGILPLQKDQKIAFIGEFAEKPRYQGGGSSHINAYKVESPLDCVKDCNVVYARGYDIQNDQPVPALEEEAVRLSAESDVAVVFAGLPERFESEGVDRTSLEMPQSHNELIRKIAAVQKNIVVVLQNGSPVTMPWLNEVRGVLELYLGGQAVGGAAVRLLFGDANPCGRLAETFPARIEDTPSFLYGYGENDRVPYNEGIFVGYRYYTKKKIRPLFPFGYGLSYTSFDYSELRASGDAGGVDVSVCVRNTGNRAGKEVVQLYLSVDSHGVIRPIRELKGFCKVFLRPGEEQKVTFHLSARDLSYWNTRIHEWHVASGEYVLQICKNAEEVVLSVALALHGQALLVSEYSSETKVEDIIQTEKGKIFWKKIVPPLAKVLMSAYGNAGGMSEDAAIASLWSSDNPLLQMGLGTICGMIRDPSVDAAAQTLFNELNAQVKKTEKLAWKDKN